MGLGGSRNRASQSSSTQEIQQGNAGAARKRSITEKDKGSWTESMIIRQISEKKLAPRVSMTSSMLDRETECPICFNDFEHLNLVNCCKQFICTECYVKLRKPCDSECMCPFCEKLGFLVTVVDGNSEPPKTVCAITATTSSDPPTATPPRSPQFRSRTSTPLYIPVSSKSDRQNIEKEIKQSRSLDSNFDSGFYRRPMHSQSAIGSTPSPSAMARAVVRRSQAGSSGSGQFHPHDTYRELTRMLEGASGFSDVNDMLLLAAIRQSMAESAPSAASPTHPPSPTPRPAPEQPPLPEAYNTPQPYSNRSRLSSSAESTMSEMSEMTEEEQMQLAISLSLNDTHVTTPSLSRAVSSSDTQGAELPPPPPEA